VGNPRTVGPGASFFFGLFQLSHPSAFVSIHAMLKAQEKAIFTSIIIVVKIDFIRS
jgi:hypothetical protein